jgi:hypothetical protein
MRLRVFENSSSTHQTTITEPPHPTHNKKYHHHEHADTAPYSTTPIDPTPESAHTPHADNPYNSHTPPSHSQTPAQSDNAPYGCFSLFHGFMGWIVPQSPNFRIPSLPPEGVRKCGFCPPPAGSPHCVRGTAQRFGFPCLQVSPTA